MARIRGRLRTVLTQLNSSNESFQLIMNRERRTTNAGLNIRSMLRTFAILNKHSVSSALVSQSPDGRPRAQEMLFRDVSSFEVGSSSPPS